MVYPKSAIGTCSGFSGMILLVPSAAVIVVMGSPLHLTFFSRHDKQARLATLRVGGRCTWSGYCWDTWRRRHM